jgi:hypothetical protein
MLSAAELASAARSPYTPRLVAAQQEVALLVAGQWRVDYPYKAPERLALRVGKVCLNSRRGGRQSAGPRCLESSNRKATRSLSPENFFFE